MKTSISTQEEKNSSHIREKKSCRFPASPQYLMSGDNKTTFSEYLSAKGRNRKILYPAKLSWETISNNYSQSVTTKKFSWKKKSPTYVVHLTKKHWNTEFKNEHHLALEEKLEAFKYTIISK